MFGSTLLQYIGWKRLGPTNDILEYAEEVEVLSVNRMNKGDTKAFHWIIKRHVIIILHVADRFCERMADFCACLKEEIPDLSDSVVQEILKHRIDRVTFIELTEDNLKEIAPLLGDRMKLKIEQKRLLSKRFVGSTVIFISYRTSNSSLTNSLGGGGGTRLFLGLPSLQL